jgi:hypothetical protein
LFPESDCGGAEELIPPWLTGMTRDPEEMHIGHSMSLWQKNWVRAMAAWCSGRRIRLRNRTRVRIPPGYKVFLG